MSKVIATLILMELLYLGCAGHPGVRNSSVGSSIRVEKTDFAQEADNIPEYRLGFGDIIEIKFFNNSEFNETITVRPDGRISLQKVGELLVLGRTPVEVDSVITKIYAEFVINPEVTVIVREFGGLQAFVLGEVEKPGGYPLTKNMTILQALAVAGGTKNSAKLNSVMVLRKDQTGGIAATKVNLKNLFKADHISEFVKNNLEIHPQDIIYVPKTIISSATDFMKMVYSGFLPPLDLYLRVIYYYDRF